MIGSDVSSLKSMLSGVFTKAAEARDKATGKSADQAKKADAAQPKDPSDPAFLLSASLEDLTRPLRGMADGASDAAKGGVEQADGALDQMSGLLEYNDAFAEQLDQVMDAMGRDLGRMLKVFGMEDDEIDEAVKGFKGRFDEDDTRKAIHDANTMPDGAQPVAVANSESHERIGVSLEVRNVDLTLEQGGKKLTISFDRSTLAMARTSESAFAVTDGKTAVSGAERSTGSLKASSEGLTVQADGFSEEELAGIMKSLQGAMTGQPEGLEGQATLKPQAAPKAGEPMHVSLDLKGLLTSAFGEKGTKAAESMGKEIQKQGFDVRI